MATAESRMVATDFADNLNYTPTQCMDEWDNNPNYYDDGVDGYMVVAETNANQFYVTIKCGMELWGVIHIAHSDSTGNVHPIYPQDNDAFSRCFHKTVNRGTIYTKPDGRRAVEWRWGSNRSEAIYNRQNGDVYTFYATGNEYSNNWHACAAA